MPSHKDLMTKKELDFSKWLINEIEKEVLKDV